MESTVTRFTNVRGTCKEIKQQIANAWSTECHLCPYTATADLR